MNVVELTAPFRKAIAAYLAGALVVVLAKVVDVPSEFGPAVESIVGGLLLAGTVYATRNRDARERRAALKVTDVQRERLLDLAESTPLPAPPKD